MNYISLTQLLNSDFFLANKRQGCQDLIETFIVYYLLSYKGYDTNSSRVLYKNNNLLNKLGNKLIVLKLWKI